MANIESRTSAGALRKMLELVIPFSNSHFFVSGEKILSPQEDSREFYYVIKGTVEVSYKDQDDTKITVALIGAGEFFGEIGYFDGETRVRDILANNEVAVGIFNDGAMQRMQVEAPELYCNFLVYITRKICEKFRRIAGDREPLSSYAESLSSRRSSSYSESRPLPPSLLHSEGFYHIKSGMEQIKAELFDLSHRLQKNEAEGKCDEAVENRCIALMGELNDSLEGFERAMDGTGYEEVMWGYVFKEVFPYLMRSRFAERAYFKPKGYAGDFLMMEHIYANTPKGEGRLGEIIDVFCLQRPGAQAIHGRRALLKDELARISGDLYNQGKSTRIMNLACGPNRELFDFISECEHSETIEALCVDVDAEALQYTNQYVNIFPHCASVRLMSENVIKWSLGKVQHHMEEMDIIYSAGLCDYLNVKLFRALISQCHKHLKPGGTLMLGNFTSHPDSLFLDKLLKWQLIYRNEEDLKELFAPTSFGANIKVISERAGVNLFAIAVKE